MAPIPIVVMERRRCCAWAAACEMGPGKGDVPDGGEFELLERDAPNMSTMPAKDERRR